MMKVTLLLARGPDRPEGDLDDRFQLEVQLAGSGQIDLEAYFQAETPWLARRYHHGQQHAFELLRLDEGWALQSSDSLDDPIWTVHGGVFRPGELVSVCRGRQEYLYRIVATEAQARAA